MDVVYIVQVQRCVSTESRRLVATELIVVEVDVKVVPERGQLEQIRYFDGRQNESLINGQLSMFVEELQCILSAASCVTNILFGELSFARPFLLARRYRRSLFSGFGRHLENLPVGSQGAMLGLWGG